MPIAAALKRGLRSVRDEVLRTGRQTPYDIYGQLDLGAGGYAAGPSSRHARRGAQGDRREDASAVILVDTGPLIALFDRRDALHERGTRTLKTRRSRLFTTIPVSTEAFHILSREGHGSDRCATSSRSGDRA